MSVGSCSWSTCNASKPCARCGGQCQRADAADRRQPRACTPPGRRPSPRAEPRGAISPVPRVVPTPRAQLRPYAFIERRNEHSPAELSVQLEELRARHRPRRLPERGNESVEHL
eukprot:1566273-Prymnesium_polylepis.1